MVNNPPANEGGIREERSIPGLKRSPGGGHGTHSSAPAWRVPGTEETDGLQSHQFSTLVTSEELMRITL